jgi:hypothetical protein
MNKTQLNSLILEAYAEVLTELNEAPDRYFYIKISKDEASQNKAQVILEDMFGIKYEIQDDPDGIILYFSVDEYDPGIMDELEGEQVEVLDTNIPQNLNESLLDQLSEEEEEEPTPEEAPDTSAPEETILEDATDTILAKFPTLKAAIVKLQTEDFKQFVESIDWISPRPTSFRINLKNGQEYIIKWTGSGFEAQILGKRYYLDKVDSYQQALDKLAILYRQGPMTGAGDGESEPVDADSGGGGGGGGDFPGEEAGGDEGGEEAEIPAGDDAPEADLGGEEIDFEDGAEPE